MTATVTTNRHVDMDALTVPCRARWNGTTMIVESDEVDQATLQAAVNAAPLAANRDANRAAIIQAIKDGMATNRTYVALTGPSGAQKDAEIKALARQQNQISRLLLGLLDGTD